MVSDNFIREEDSLSEEDQRILKGLHQQDRVDPVTGRKAKRINVLNKRQLSKQEMDEFFLDF